jgi:hypothetical protein
MTWARASAKTRRNFHGIVSYTTPQHDHTIDLTHPSDIPASSHPSIVTPTQVTMFVPRALRLKGVRETRQPQRPQPPPTSESESTKDEALVEAMQGISTSSPTPQQEHIDPKVATRGPRFTVKPITSEYLAQLVAGVELIFSDYAHHEEVRADWLQKRYRTVDGEDKCTRLYLRPPNTCANVWYSRPSYSRSREPIHNNLETCSHAGPASTSTTTAPLQYPRAREQWLPCPPETLLVSSQTSPPEVFRAGQR